MRNLGKLITVNLRDPHSDDCTCALCQMRREGKDLELPDVELVVRREIPIEFDIDLPPVLPSFLIELEMDEFFV